MSATPQMPCCGGHVTPVTTHLLSSGLSNSASEKPLSDSSTTSFPHISGSVAEFWEWMEDAVNCEWAMTIFPVERGYSDRNIFVTKLPLSFDDRDLQTMFSTLGEVVSAKVMLNVSTGASKGTGFVQYACAKDALRARTFLRLRPTVTEPAMPEVGTQWALNKHDGGVYGDRSRMARKLFLRNIPVSVTNEEMRSLVTKFGEVAEVTLHADTYDAAATAAAAAPRGKDSGEEEEVADAGATAAAGDASTATPPPQRSLRICFITFQLPGVAAKACAALHNTKPFRACGDIPVMAKIAEDNNARQARHQQGSMHRPELRTASPNVAGHPRALMGRNGQKRQGGGNVSPMHNHAAAAAPWCGANGNFTNGLPCGSLNSNNMCGLSGASDMTGYSGSATTPLMMMQPGYAPDFSYHTFAAPTSQPYVNNVSNGWCAPRSMSGGSCPSSSCATAPIPGVAGGFARLAFQPQNPYAAAAAAATGGAVSAQDSAAPATSGTPRALSETASPTMKLPMMLCVERSRKGSGSCAAGTDSRRPSRRTLSASMSSGKARIPATITSAPTSPRGASREVSTHSLSYSRNAGAARTMPSSVFGNSTSASGVYSAEVLTSPSFPTLLQSQPSTRPVTAATAVVAAAAAAVAPVSPRGAAHLHHASSQSSDTTSSCSREALSGHRAHHIDVSATRAQRIAVKAQHRCSYPTAFTRESPHSSPLTAAQMVLLPSSGCTTASTSGMYASSPLSLTRPAWESAAAAAQEETVISPHAMKLSASCGTSATTPTRYRNNPYGMSIVLEKAHSTSFAEA